MGLRERKAVLKGRTYGGHSSSSRQRDGEGESEQTGRETDERVFVSDDERSVIHISVELPVSDMSALPSAYPMLI